MCDYSLHNVTSRPAKVGDKLITTTFWSSITHGFAGVDEPNVAVCLLPGTELTFANEIEIQYQSHWLPVWNQKVASRVAVFRQVNMDQPNTHHDALELPDGHFALVNDLSEGQLATILQLPAIPRAVNSEHRQPSSLVA